MPALQRKAAWAKERLLVDLRQSVPQNGLRPFTQRAPNPQPNLHRRLNRVKARSSPARGYKFGRVCSYMAGHEDAGVVTGHTGTNTPKFVPPRWGRPRFDPTQTGLCKFGCGFGAR